MKTSKSDKQSALKEAVIDTALGSIVNVPLNFALVGMAFYYELSAVQTSIFLTGIFTIIAIVRKTAVRLHFIKREREKAEQIKLNA